ncbi:MAG: CRP/FNR family transcriptional regulator, partial [Flavobacterium sp.]
MKQELFDSYNYIFEEELLEEVSKVGTHKEFKANDYLIEIGDSIKSM